MEPRGEDEARKLLHQHWVVKVSRPLAYSQSGHPATSEPPVSAGDELRLQRHYGCFAVEFCIYLEGTSA